MVEVYKGLLMNYRGYDRWSSNWTSMHRSRPAYPNNNEPLDEIGNEPDNSIQALETAEDIPPHNVLMVIENSDVLEMAQVKITVI